jgi:hypothetical protein
MCGRGLPAASAFAMRHAPKRGQAKGRRNARAIELTTRRVDVGDGKLHGVDLPKDATYGIPTERND